MKPVLEHLPLDPEASFVVKAFDYSYYPTPWHFHPEYEIVLVTESSGKRFIGDSISDFKAGDLAFIGSNLPHLYRNDAEYYETNERLRAKSIVIHFSESSLGNNFLTLPEARGLKTLFSKSLRGLDVMGATCDKVTQLLQDILLLSGLTRWLKLLEILNLLSESDELTYISNSIVAGKNEMESDRMNRIFEYVLNNFSRPISIAEIASEVHLAENSFSRYFSNRTRKSFITFVNEVRLNHACKLLQEGKLSVAEICYASGYNNLSNFNRQFKNVYEVSPLNYTKQFYKG